MKPVLVFAALLLTAFGSALAIDWTDEGGRPDCPGKIECPLTGELVCEDRCPLVDPNRADCPGKIECPLTGELVCEDQCPLNSSEHARVTDGTEFVDTNGGVSAECCPPEPVSVPACCSGE